jgi:hypothetical protein
MQSERDEPRVESQIELQIDGEVCIARPRWKIRAPMTVILF